MKINFRTLLSNILNPPTYVKVLTFILAVLSCTLALIFVFNGQGEGAFSIIAYVLFGLSGATLTYSVYLVIPLFKKAKDKTIAWMKKHEFTYLLLKNFGFRKIIFAIGSFLMSILFSAFNAYMGIVNRSIWYGALAGFYIALAFLRGGVLVYHKNRIGKKVQNDEQTKAKVYRNSGIVILILNLALSSAIAQMIFSNAHFTYMGWTIFAFAFYAFFKITTSIIGFIKARKQSDLTVKAIVNINFIDAIVSILALQTALLATFGDGNVNLSLFNTLTGIVVSFLSISTGVYMIISAKTHQKKKKERKNNEQSI